MKQLTLISGKSGTGKTSLTAAFASIANDAVIADCDVDTANLHLILKPENTKTMGFHGLKIAYIDTGKCTECKNCIEFCKFNAIDNFVNIIVELCEGCGVCEYVCKVDAIRMIDRDSGLSYTSNTKYGPMAHAMLNTAEGSFSKLVKIVRKNAKNLAQEKNKNLIIIDGPSGIGSPVISSIKDVDLVLIVTEPSISAINHLKRTLSLVKQFNIHAVVCINKFDINIENTENIESYCRENNIEIVGRIPYDEIVTEAMIKERTIVEYSDEDISKKVKEIWNEVTEKLSHL